MEINTKTLASDFDWCHYCGSLPANNNLADNMRIQNGIERFWADQIYCRVLVMTGLSNSTTSRDFIG